MPNRILLIHEDPSVADELLHAFDERGFACTSVQTVDEALDYLCLGGQASVILYDTARCDTTWLFGRAQEANPALLRIPLIALSPLHDGFERGRSEGAGDPAPIDLTALLLIVGQLCRLDASGPGPMSREP